MHKRRKRKPYWTLSRSKRRDNYIRLRQKIRNDTSVYGGFFTSHQIINEPGRPPLYNQWADILFLGSDGLTIWNTEIITVTREFWDRVEEMAHTRAWEMLTPDEQEFEAEMKFEPIRSGGKKMYCMVEKPKQVYEKFGGLTYHDYQDKLVEEIIQNEPPEIYESFTTDRTYCYGTGLYIVIHVDEINQASIEDAIRRFREAGETDWQAAEPVRRSELPMESADAAFNKVKWEPKGF
jgi:hypothetical protein